VQPVHLIIGQEFNDYFQGGYQDKDLELLSFDQTALEHNQGKPY